MEVPYCSRPIPQQLKTVYPEQLLSSASSSASWAVIEESLQEKRGLGAGRHLALTFFAAAINFVPAPVLATIVVTNGGVASNKILAGVGYVGPSDDGAMDVSSGGLAVNTAIHSGGYQYIYTGGAATSSTITFLGMQFVLSGGSATDTTLSNKGEQYVSSGGRANNTTISGGGHQYVESGGYAVGIVQADGADVHVSVYGGDTQTVVSGTNASGNFSLSNGSASGFILYGYLTEQKVYSNGVATSSTLSGGQQTVLNGGLASFTTINSGGYQFVSAGGTATDAMISSGGSQNIRGSAIDTKIYNGGKQYVRAGGSATSTTINSGGMQVVYSGGSATSTTIREGLQQVAGNVSITTISNDGLQEIYNGGRATSTTINSSGVQVVYSGGQATSTTLSGGGQQEIFDGGSASSTMISSGGVQIVSSGGSAISTTISDGGLQSLDSNATAMDTNVQSGGMLNVSSGGHLTGTLTVANGGMLAGYIHLTDAVTLQTSANDVLVLSGNTTQLVYEQINDAILADDLSGAGNLTKAGTGTLILSGNNTYQGTTTINEGTLRYTGINRLSNPIRLNGGVLDVDGMAAQLTADIAGVSGTRVRLQHGGTLTGAIDRTDVAISTGGIWNMTSNSLVHNLQLDGTLVFAQPASTAPTTYKALAIPGKLDGNGNITMNTNLGAGQGDQVIVQETAGSHTLYINNTGGAPSNAVQALKIIDVINPAQSNAIFTLSGNYVDVGAHRYTLEQGTTIPQGMAGPIGDVGDWYLSKNLSAPGKPILSNLSQQGLAMSSAIKYTTQASLNDVHRRLGELRLDDDQHQADAWVRAYRKDYENRINPEAQGKQKVSGVDIGIDRRIDHNSGRFYVGGLFSYGQSDFKGDNRGGSMNSTEHQLGVYTTWLGAQGTYVDLIGRHFWFDRDYRFDQTNAQSETASAKSHAYSLDIEVGHRIDFNAGWFIEPQAEITWLRSQKSSFVTDKNTKLTLERGSNLDLRAGLMGGKTVRDQDGSYQMYGKLDRLQALSSSNDIMINDTRLNSKKENAAWVVGAGLQVAKKNTQLHVEVEAGLGNPDIKQKWGLNFGARWKF